MTKKKDQTQLDPQIEQLQNQVNELDLKYKRALADYQNQEKRTVAARINAAKFANEQLLTSLLPVLDDLARAQAHLKDPGLGHILNTLQATLKDFGLASFSPQGEPFDPLTMECVEVVTGPKDQVVSVSQQGFKLEDKIIRPAKVTVGNQPQEVIKN